MSIPMQGATYKDFNRCMFCDEYDCTKDHVAAEMDDNSDEYWAERGIEAQDFERESEVHASEQMGIYK